MGQSVCSNTQIGKFNQGVSGVVERTSAPEKLSLVVRISNIVRYSINASLHILSTLPERLPFGAIKSMTKVATSLKILALVTLPSTFARIRAGELAEAKASLSEMFDIYLARIEAYATIGEIFTKAVEAFTLFFTEIGLAGGLNAYTLTRMGNFVTSVAGPLTIALAILQGCGMILTTKNLIETHRFSVIFNKSAALHKPVEEYALDDYSAARMLIETKQTKESSFVGKHFDTNSKKMIDRLQAIELVAKEAISSANPLEELEGRKLLKTTMQTLSERMSSKKWSQGRSLLTAAVGNIGFGLVYSPCPAAGFALCGASCGISIGNFFYDRHKINLFETALGIAGEQR